MNSRTTEGQSFNPFAIGIAFTGLTINVPLQLYTMIALPDAAFGLIVAGLTLVLLTGSANFAGLVWQMLGYREEQSEA